MLDPDQPLTIRQLAPGDSGPATLYSSADLFTEGERLPQALSGGLHTGLINLPGWVPLMASVSEYTTGDSAADAGGVPSQVVNLDDGRAITLPPLAPPIEVGLDGPLPTPSGIPNPTEVAWPLGEIELTTDPAIAPYDLEFRYVWNGELGSPAAAQTVGQGETVLLNRTAIEGTYGVVLNGQTCTGSFDIHENQVTAVQVAIEQVGTCKLTLREIRPLETP